MKTLAQQRAALAKAKAKQEAWRKSKEQDEQRPATPTAARVLRALNNTTRP